MHSSIIIISALSLMGFYGEPHLSLELGDQAWTDPGRERVVFFAFVQAHRPARGLAAFPDGGRPKMLYKNLSLYRWESSSGDLQRLHDFGPLPLAKSAWRCRVHSSGDSVFFRIEPVSGWSNELKWRRLSREDRERYDSWLAVGPDGRASKTAPRAQEAGTDRPLPPQIKGSLKQIAWKQWGIDLDIIAPLSRREAVENLSGLKGNQHYRNALAEQWAGRLEKEEVLGIISRIRRVSGETPAANETVIKLQEIFQLGDE
jgi:hypothetical protein